MTHLFIHTSVSDIIRPLDFRVGLQTCAAVSVGDDIVGGMRSKITTVLGQGVKKSMQSVLYCHHAGDWGFVMIDGTKISFESSPFVPPE